jgi:hypothetical protein
MATVKPIIKSALTSSSIAGNLKKKLEDIDPIDEAEETTSMIKALFDVTNYVFCVFGAV